MRHSEPYAPNCPVLSLASLQSIAQSGTCIIFILLRELVGRVKVLRSQWSGQGEVPVTAFSGVRILMRVLSGRVHDSEYGIDGRSFPDTRGPNPGTGCRTGFWALGLHVLTLAVIAVLAGCGGQPVTVHLGALTAGAGTFQSGLPATLVLPAGFAGTPVANQTTVVMAPQSGTDTTRSLTVTSVTAGTGGSFVLTVTLPTLTITAPATYVFTASGVTLTSSFDTSPGTAILIQPGPQLLSVTPATARAAQTLDVTISGISTTFVNGTTQASFGAGVSVNGAAAGGAGTVSVTNGQTAVAHLVIDPAATAGTRTVTVTTGSQTLTLASAFTVTPLPTPPVPSAGGPYTGTTGSVIAFTGTGSSDPAGLALTYAWTFGDGGTATGVAPTHTYATAGHYTATVIVTNSQGAAASATANVTVNDPPKPPVAGAGGPYTGTTGSAVNFSASSSTDPGGLALTYAWTFGDGGTGTGVAPTHTYAAAGTYTVTVTATNSASLTNSASTTVTITDAPQPPVANAGGPYTGTAGTAVAFSGAGSTDPKGKALTYAWTFGDGGTGTGVSTTHTYAAAGTFAVSLTVTNTDSLSSTKTTTATIVAAPQPPVANAGGPYAGTAGTAVSFSGAGSTDPKSEALTYAWTFGEGGTGTGGSPTHTYAAAGTYTISLTVTNTDSLNSTTTATAMIVAAPQPPVANAGGPYAGTAGTAVSFSGAGSTDPKSEALTYAWTFGDGGTGTGVSPTHTYAAAGTYTVSLTVTNTDSLSATASTTATLAAAPQPPVANPGGPYSGTAGTPVTFNGAGSTDPKSEPLTYAWSFGDGATATGAAPTHPYATAGTYTVSLTVTNTDNLHTSATTTATIAVPAAQPPVANAGGPYTGTAGTAVSFNGSGSADPKSETLTYAWSFGDGGTATGPTPTHTYAVAGTFAVSLTVTNTDSLTATSSATATIAAAPQAPVANAGGPYNGTAGVAVSFSGAGSSDPKSETLTYAWTFGDGGTATGVAPTHTYAAAGTYTATLTVSNTDHLSASASATAVIAAAPQPPVANAGGPYTGTAGTAVTFSGAASSDPKSEALSYAWSFGDGGTGTGIAPTHTYAAAGTFNIALVVTNTDGLSSAAATTTAVIAAAAPQLPVANAGGPYTGTAGVAVSFVGAGSTDPKGETLTYAWTFGDGGTSTATNPTHIYATAGTYNVSLIVTNTDNLHSTAATTAAVIAAAAAQPPVANAGNPYTGVAGTPLSFNGSGSSDPKSEVLTYAWTFGDDGTGTGSSPTHTYAAAGTYTVTLTVTNTDNLTASATVTATIAAGLQAPVANAGGPYSGTTGVAVSFSGAASTDPKSETLTYAWTFGDGGTATGVAPTHTYSGAGTYTVSLTVTNTDNLTSTASTSATIAAPTAQPPVARPGGPYTGVANTAVNFTGATSSDPKGEALTYAWTYGDGSGGSGATPSHTYAVAGTYTVSLTVTNTDSASATATTTATLSAAPAVAPVVSTGGPYTGTVGQTITFNGAKTTDPANPAGSPFALSYAWSFGDGATASGPSPVHTYATNAAFTVTLTVTTPSGGAASSTTTATIAPADTPLDTAPTVKVNGPYTGTVNNAVTFSSGGTSDPNNAALTYVWSFGDGGTGSGASPTHSYVAAGTYSVVLTVGNGSNTVAAGTTATITGGTPTPNLTASAGGPYTGNVNRPVHFDGTGTTDPSGRQLTYLWDFGDGSTGGSSQPSHTYAASGTYTVSVNVTDGATGNGNATTQVTVGGPAPESIAASAGGPYTDVTGHTITFDASSSTDSLDNPVTYTWNFGDGTTGSGATPAHAYSTAGTYTATVTVSSGTVSGTATASARIATALNVMITTPAANALFGTNTVTVSGSVSGPGLSVNVNGIAATVSGTSFTATGVSLREGVNLITATATDSGGGVGSGTVSVILDATAPTVSITSPANGATVSSPSVTVAGLVNDIVTGTIGSNDVTVSVNGVAAQVANRSYSLNNVLLVPGSNTITVVATDNVGHTSSATATVQYAPPASQLALVLLSGNGQSGEVHAVLPQPLVVQLQAADGTPVAGRPITFTVTRSDGEVQVMPSTAQSLYVTTDSTGKASVLFQLGSRTGLGVNQVTASTPGASGSVLFTADATSTVATEIHAVRGENQRGLLGEPLSEALQVIVTDAFANPIAGTTVNYAIVSGDGTLDHGSAVTDSNGKAAASLTLGQQEGLGNYAVSANFAGSSQPPIVFVASGFAAGPVANTSVSGLVLDNSNTPIANVTMRLLGTTLSTVTDTSGRFTINGAPVGTVTLSADGSTSTSTRTFPFLSFVLQDLPGQNNSINKPIYLPFIDVDDAQTVGGDDPITLTMRGVPGLSFTIAPHSVTFPDGSTVGKMSISQVKADMVPMAPSNGTAPDLIWTLQPAGARFSVPVQVTLPNTQSLPPGMVSEMYQYDHDLEQFVSAGTAHVSADGSVIVSDPGFGITKAGWGHGPNTPAPPNCTQSCKPSNNCARWTQTANCQCIKTPINNGAACGSSAVTSCINPGKCVNGNCNSGPKPNGTSCDDNRFCTEPDQCSAGLCKGTPIPDKPDPNNIPGVDQVSIQQNFSLISGNVATFLDSLKIPVQLQPTFQLNYNKGTLTCCQALQQKNVSIHENSFQAGLQAVAGPYPIIIGAVPLGVYVPGLGTQGLFGNVQVAFLGVYAHRVDNCKMSDCYLSGPQGSIQLSGGLGVNLGKWANANVSLSGGLAADLTFGCGQATFKFYTLPIQVQGQVTLLTGTSVPVVNKILVNSYVIYQKTVPF